MDSHAITINDLPDEILLRIIKYCHLKDLINLRIVSKRWSLICEDNVLFRSILLSNDLDFKEIKVILEMMNTFPIQMKILDREDLKYILKCFKGLSVRRGTIPEFSNEHNKNMTVSFYFENCKCGISKIEHNVRVTSTVDSCSHEPVFTKYYKNFLKIKKCCYFGTSLILLFFTTEISDALRKIFFKNLKEIDISYISQICSSCCIPFCLCYDIKKVVEGCPNLISFKLKNNMHRNKTLNCKRNISLIYRMLCHSASSMAILKLSAEFLSDVDIEFTKYLCNLQTLHLYCARNITSLEPFKYLKQLSSFVITENIIISPSAWVEFLGHPEMVLIERLGFDECLIDDTVLYCVSRTCKNLRKLTLSGCRNDGCELTSASLLAVFNSCKKLEKVNMNYVDRELQTAVNFSPDNIKSIDFVAIN